MCSQVGHVHLREDLLGGAGVVVGRATHQRESGQGNDRVDHAVPVLDEVLLDRGSRVEPGRECRDHPQSARLHRGDHAIVVAGIAGQQVRAQHQNPDGAGGRTVRGAGERRRIGRYPTHHPRMVDAHVRILDRRLRLGDTAQTAPRTVGVAIDQHPDHVQHVLVGAAEPVLKRQEVGAQILRGTGNESQHLRQPPQHLHLGGAAGGGLLLVAAQLLEQRHRPGGRLVHVEMAGQRQLHDLGGRCHADHGVAVVAPCAQVGQDRQEVLLQEQHARDDDVAPSDVGPAAFDLVGLAGELGGGVHLYRDAGQLAPKRGERPLECARKMGVHRHDDDVHRRCVNG